MALTSVASFSQAADLYARYRPQYPESLYHWLLPLCRERVRAWDCGTGNGQNAVRLGDHFQRVDATDISAAQLTEAEVHEQVYYRECPAEVTPFDDAAFDLVTAAQALHWFHFPSFWPEVERVLKPGGLFAAWGYSFCQVTPEVDQALAVYLSIIEPFWSSKNQLLWEGYQQVDCPWPRMETPEFSMQVDWDVEQFLGYLETWSASKLCRQTLGARVLDEAVARIRRAWGEARITRRVSMSLSMLAARKPE